MLGWRCFGVVEGVDLMTVSGQVSGDLLDDRLALGAPVQSVEQPICRRRDDQVLKHGIRPDPFDDAPQVNWRLHGRRTRSVEQHAAGETGVRCVFGQEFLQCLIGTPGECKHLAHKAPVVRIRPT